MKLIEAWLLSEKLLEQYGKKPQESKKGNAYLLEYLFSDELKKLLKEEREKTILTNYRYSSRKRRALKNPRKIYHRDDVYFLGEYDFFIGLDMKGGKSDGKIYIDTGGIMKFLSKGRAYPYNALDVLRDILHGVFESPTIGVNHTTKVPALYAYSNVKGIFWKVVIDLEGEHAGMITTAIPIGGKEKADAESRYQNTK